MASQADLQADLEALLGSENVYFQPPSGTQLSYPCITYERDLIKTKFANNSPYNHADRYLVKIIERSLVDSAAEKIKTWPKCSFVRAYRADGLYHTIFNLYH